MALVDAKHKPPVGGMGGSVHDWERGIDPFSRQCMPPEFQSQFENKPPVQGWLALDWCGNVIGFLPDSQPRKSGGGK